MVGVVCRTLAICLAISLVAIPAAHIIGSLSPNTVIIGYHENEGEIYVTYIQDASRHFRWWLAGTRCFKPLPPWAYQDPIEGSPDSGRDFTRRVERVEELIELFDCR